MDKLRSMNSKQLGIFTAIVVAVLGVVGVLSGEMILQIVIAAVQALIIIWVMTQIVSGGTSEKKASDKYRKLFMNLPIGFAQAEIITDGAGDAVGYKVVDANNTFGSYFNLDREEFVGKVLGDGLKIDKAFPKYR